MTKVYLIEGPVGAGKSTYAEGLSEKILAPHLDLDAWMANLFIPDRPITSSIDWYLECKRRCTAQMWDVALKLLRAEVAVILELGLVTKAERKNFYHLVTDAGYPLVIHILDTPLAIRRERVKKRNFERIGTYAMEVTNEMFDRANTAWEEPDSFEQVEQEFVFV